MTRCATARFALAMRKLRAFESFAQASLLISKPSFVFLVFSGISLTRFRHSRDLAQPSNIDNLSQVVANQEQNTHKLPLACQLQLRRSINLAK